MDETTALDFGLATEGLTTITEGITSFFTSNWALILGVAAVPIGFWLIRFCIRLIKSLSNSGK